MNSLKFYIDKLKDCDAHEVINSLRVNPVLSVEEKNLIYLYLSVFTPLIYAHTFQVSFSLWNVQEFHSRF